LIDPVLRDPNLDAVRAALLAANRVVITTHIRPDGDAIGSELGVALFLQKLGKEVHVINADPEPRTIGWLMDPYRGGLVQVYEEGRLAHAEAFALADAVLVADTNTLTRLGTTAAPTKGTMGKKLLLDHHPDPETWFDVACTRTDASAAGELVYSLIAGHDPDLIDTAIATALYSAIMTDTGSFRYNATTARTHAIVADLLSRGDITPEPIHVAIHDGRSREGLRLLSRSLDTIATHYGGRVASMYVSSAMLRETGAFSDEMEGLVQYALSLDGVQAAVILLELAGGVKASFRSKGTCAINGWANRFGGGGHANASGAFLKGFQLTRALKEVIDQAPRHLQVDPTVQETPEDDGSALSPDDLALLSQFQGSIDKRKR
jgi:bifunctional oligoribonuclease and PAP phosphatase NrnA